MSVTLQNIIDHVDRYVGDASTDRISNADRYQYITEAVVWIQEELENDHQVATYTLNHLDTVYRYEILTNLADLLVGADLKSKLGKNTDPFFHRSSRELNDDIALGGENSWAVEREDENAYLLVNYNTSNLATTLDLFSSVDNWSADTAGSDALNVTLDSYEYRDGTSSLNFDLDVSQSVNNYGTVENTTDTNGLGAFEDTGTFLINIYIPDVTYTSSVTIRWGNDSSNYWTATVATDIDGNALVDEYNLLAFEWAQATMVGTPTTTIDYKTVQVNYTASQTDDTDYRLDFFRIAKDTDLKFSYLSWNVGKDTGGSDITAFTASTDVPYFSGQYDQYIYAVAHKAAALTAYALRLPDEAREQTILADRAMSKKKKLIPRSRTKEGTSFKVHGINFSRR